MNVVRLTLCILAVAYVTAHVRAEELPDDVTQALAEYTRKRADVLKRTDSELAKLRETLLKKLEKIQRAQKAGDDDAKNRIEELRTKINGLAFTEFEMEQILKNNAKTITTQVLRELERRYRLNQMTEQEWIALPAVAINAKARDQADTTIDLKAGETVVICPHPTQKWRKGKDQPWCTWNSPGSDGALISTAKAAVVGDDVPQEIFLRDSIILTARIDGRLFVKDFIFSWSAGEPEGSMSFKIFRVKDR